MKPFGRALSAYVSGDTSASIMLHTSLGEYDSLPVSIFFREPDQLLPFEVAAMNHCRGRVLDVGAGTGVHALLLQERGLGVTAVDILPEAVDIMKDRGVADARRAEMFEVRDREGFDTILMMMNGTGPLETLDGLDRFLDFAPHLLRRGGCVVLDSSAVEPQDPPENAPPGDWPDEPSSYVGEVWIRIEFDGERGRPFRELYLDHATLQGHAARAGWRCDVVFLEEYGTYTAVMHPPSRSVLQSRS
jgi:SAM-dependent methyltransferase